ncbi:hypothetical protein AUC71_05595 [Methyloceanibacter marginalis]|uniref:Uncharacterized protein n=1 Tax=Methyloceanibacter marginalis TaxID=1774971 RepID=A0A1E3WEB5_9HYPH|nr:DEAD/DEAH box helicase [Methyloceanibacter marginalis]ODS04159.1 hypothetical protein AUC71_05595 [Methyloceanibacter marginalis]
MSEIGLLRSIGPDEALTSGQVFDVIFEAGSVLSESDREAEVALEIAIRLLEARRNGQVPKDCIQAVEFLAEECGLYPYIEAETFGLLTQTVIEAHAVQLDEKLYLHSKQMQILLWLLDGDSVVLSAPTSFGKSLLVDAFLARKRPHTVVVILPTIALIDETRRRYGRNFGDFYKVITTVADSYNPEQPTIFVLTQERFLQRKDDLKIDLLFVDEFYKLDPSRGDTRYETLNLALYRALPVAKQSFMAGPHIRNIELGPKWSGNFRFVRTDYRTVTVNVVDRSESQELFATFLSDLNNVGDESSLVFTATPNTAQRLMDQLVDSGIAYESILGPQLAAWVERNYHPAWPVARGNQRGIAIHHGRLPRSLGQLFVHLFNTNEIKVLICTSTLIEGVNTSAANVFIYDKKINRADFDFFSFANIRGRVGRMMRHFIGNVFLYHQPPKEVETDVQVPILNDPGSSTDFLVMNVAPGELSTEGRQRQENLPLATGLSAHVLREHGALGVELLAALRDRIEQVLNGNPELLVWSGFPDRDQRKAIAELALMVAHKRNEPTGVHSPGMIGWAWSLLGSIRTLPKFLRFFAGKFFTDDRAAGVDAAFQFLQACEFSFPRTLAAVEAIVLDLQPDSEVAYGPYIVGLETWFRPPWMKELDEAGIPLPLAERLAPHLSTPSSRADALNQIARLDLRQLEGFDEVDYFIVSLALR